MGNLAVRKTLFTQFLAIIALAMFAVAEAPNYAVANASRLAYPHSLGAEQSMPLGLRLMPAPIRGALVNLATVLTTAGIGWVVDNLDATLSTTGDYMAWGTGAGTAAVGDTTLFTEASEARVVSTRSQPAADTLRWVATITANGTKTITNSGNLTASSAGTLIVHGDFTGVALVLNDAITFTNNLQFT